MSGNIIWMTLLLNWQNQFMPRFYEAQFDPLGRNVPSCEPWFDFFGTF